MSNQKLVTPYLIYNKFSSKPTLSLPPIKKPKSYSKQLDESRDLESKFFLYHKFNKSWNIEDLTNLGPVLSGQNLHTLPVETEENKSYMPIDTKNKEGDLSGFLRRCNCEFIDSVVLKSEETRKVRKKQTKNKQRKFESCQISKNCDELFESPEISRLKFSSNFNGFDKKKESRQQLKLSQINEDDKINNTLNMKENPFRSFKADFASFLRRSKQEDNFKNSFLRHIAKLNDFRENKRKAEEKIGKIDQKLQELMVNNFRRQNKLQMEIENRKKIESLKGLGGLIDQEITQQDQTLDNLMKSFKDIIELKNKEVNINGMLSEL